MLWQTTEKVSIMAHVPVGARHDSLEQKRVYMFHLSKNSVQAPMWFGYLFERFPLISNIYTVLYERHEDDGKCYATFTKRQNPSKSYHSARAILGAFLHDLLNPLRLVDSLLTTATRWMDFFIINPLLDCVNFFTSDALLNENPPLTPRIVSDILLQGLATILLLVPMQIIRVLTGFFTRLQLDTFYNATKEYDATKDNIPTHPIEWPVCTFDFSMLFFGSFKTRGPFHWLNQKLHFEPGILDVHQHGSVIRRFNEAPEQFKTLLIEEYDDTIASNPGIVYFFSDLLYQSVKKILQKLKVIAVAPEITEKFIPDPLEKFEQEWSDSHHNKKLWLDETPLHFATVYEPLPIVNFMLQSRKYKKMINEKTEGVTPLELAINNIYPIKATLLIENGATIPSDDRINYLTEGIEQEKIEDLTKLHKLINEHRPR